MDNFFLGLILLIGSVFVARNILNKASQHLSIGQKAELVEMYSKTSRWSNAIIIGLLVGYYLVSKNDIFDPVYMMYGFFTVIVIYIIVKGIYDYNRLRSRDFPKEYLVQWVGSVAIRLVSLVAYVFFFT